MTQPCGKAIYYELEPVEDITPEVLPYFPGRATSFKPYYASDEDCTCASYPHIARCAVTEREGGFRIQLSKGATVWEQKLNPNADNYVILFRQDFDVAGYPKDFATAFATPDGKVVQILRFHSLEDARNNFRSRCLRDVEVH